MAKLALVVYGRVAPQRKAAFERAFETARRVLNVSGQKVSLSFASVSQMRALNKRYAGKAYATDVLAFPYREARDFVVPRSADKELGAIVICLPIAKKQALKKGVSEERELLFLFFHGLAHLGGFDHGTAAEKKRMDRVVERLSEAAAAAP